MRTTEFTVGGHLLEVEILPASKPGTPTLVLLHEGLGCVAMWRDFPALLAAATGCQTVVYSRYGYGRSDPFAEARTVRYMHDEALQSLPALLDQLEVDDPLLVGHSDGASIALLHAGAAERRDAGLVLFAPHVFVEDVSIAGIEAAKRSYVEGDLRRRLARYHRDPDATFFGWNDIWLAPEFRSWNIEGVLANIGCPVLIVQGAADPYGTLAQTKTIEERVQGPVERLVIEGCGHAPQLEEPERTLGAVAAFVNDHSAASLSPERMCGRVQGVCAQSR